MLTRIVKLSFKEENLDEFIQFFNSINSKVSSFPGCQGMRLHQDMKQPNVIFTYSKWDSEDALNAYRDSELFKGVWSTIKPIFSAKAEAWSCTTYYEGGF